VLAAVPGAEPAHAGASPSCALLFDVTLRGLREEAQADPTVAPAVRLADAAYDAQHPVADAERLVAALDWIATALGKGPAALALPRGRPAAWRTTVADVAADLDVIELQVLVESWARSVLEDWNAVQP
jgi:hypothetical protein